jgi:hypothetical protein
LTHILIRVNMDSYYKKDGDKMKSENIIIKVAPSMKRELKISAEKKDMTMSEYIRFLYIQDAARTKESEVDNGSY